MINRKYNNYDKFPRTKIKGFDSQGWDGYDSIISEIKPKINGKKFILVIETYPGVNTEEIYSNFNSLNPDLVIDMKDLFKTEEVIKSQLEYHLTDDRVFGKIYYGEVKDFIDAEKTSRAVKKIQDSCGLIIVYGFGSSRIIKGDCLLFCDMSRWEIQLRYRRGDGNYLINNGNEEFLKKYKLGYFIEWRIADKNKMSFIHDVDYYLDSNIVNSPKMITGEAYIEGLNQIACRPFRTVPYFDPGVWGGQWMKSVCDLDRSKDNFAWSFDGVPEENSLLMEFNNLVIESPAINLVLIKPKDLLGDQVYSRFGAEYPIRFDFLDTIGGQNLSLQVHPLTEYIHNNFGMSYTQDESYYILDAEPDTHVYLGLKENISPIEMINDLKSAEEGDINFDAEKYVNKFSAKKHDHFLIPAGTIHCSGAGCMVLEISATPYIFTFKLWDWGRLGLDGKPRPIHISHGEKVIQWDRTTKWVEKNLVNQIYEISKSGDYIEEHTGLHELEFIETRRYWVTGVCQLDTMGTFHMLNLVEGKSALIESLENKFEAFEVHYAETFIVPASVGRYTIKPLGCGRVGVIKAYVKSIS